MELKRYEGEGREHFIWRIYKYKEDTGKLSKEIAGEVCRNGLNEAFDESAYRKMYESFRKMWEEVKSEYVDEESLINRISEIELREDELYKQQVKTRDQFREKRKTLRDEARIENLMDTIWQVASDMPEFNLGIDKKKFGTDKAVLRISDWHLGKNIDSFWNKYNKTIAKERVDKLIFETIKYCEKFDIGTLYVATLGDMIDGAIHGNARVANEEDFIQQIMTASELISYMLEALYEYGLEVKYLSVLDNHSRANKDYKEHIEKENFGNIIQWYIEARMKDKIEFIDNMIDENVGYVEIDGKSHFFVHGHLKAHSTNTVIQNLALSLRTTVDYVHMGHFHSSQTKDFQFAKVYINGSLCGVDAYAQSMGLFSYPTQSMIVIDGDSDIRIDMKL